MAIHVLEQTQTVSTTLDTCWDFFSAPDNLARITPPDLGFEVLSTLPESIYAGLMIRYRVSPLLGIPVTWLTEITQVEPLRYFVDEQRIGPYKLWHHEHFFSPVTEGVEIRDLVHYQLPFDMVSDLVHPLVVAPRLKQIFDFRNRTVAELFPKTK